MWFSGFGLKKNRLFFKEKLKWKLQGLEHLRKFIYEDQIFVEFLDHPNMKLMKIEDYEIALYEMSFTLLKK